MFDYSAVLGSNLILVVSDIPWQSQHPTIVVTLDIILYIIILLYNTSKHMLSHLIWNNRTPVNNISCACVLSSFSFKQNAEVFDTGTMPNKTAKMVMLSQIIHTQHLLYHQHHTSNSICCQFPCFCHFRPNLIILLILARFEEKNNILFVRW